VQYLTRKAFVPAPIHYALAWEIELADMWSHDRGRYWDVKLSTRELQQNLCQQLKGLWEFGKRDLPRPHPQENVEKIERSL
jgi:hypothetical protein